MSIALRLAWRYLSGRKLRTALTTLAIVFGVMLIFGLNGVLPGMRDAMQRMMLAAIGEVDLTVTSASSAPFPAEVAQRVAEVRGVGAATPVARRTVAMPAKPDYKVTSLVVVGIDPATAYAVRPMPVADGRLLEERDDAPDAAPAAIASRATAEKMGVKVGDAIVLPSASGTTEVTLVGTIDSPAPPGSDELYVPLSLAQEMFALGDRITDVDAVFEATADRTAVERAVKDRLGDAYTIGGIATESTLAAGFDAAAAIFNVLGFFALAMGGFIILNTFRTVVAERRHDIGMLRATGASRRTILGLFLTESLLQGAIGTGLGLLAGWGFAVFVSGVLRGYIQGLMRMEDFGVVFEPQAWVLAVGLGMGVTVLAAVVPARAAARITPLDALRPQIGDVYEKAATRRAWAGLALIVVGAALLFVGSTGAMGLGCVLILVGMSLGAATAVKPITDATSRAIEAVYRSEGGVARANLQRNPGRAGATASAVMISIALVVMIFGMTSSVLGGYGEYAKRTTGTDFLLIPNNLIVSGGAVGAGPELAQRIRATDGIAAVATLRYAPAVVQGMTVQVIGIDPDEYGRIASFRWTEGSSDADLERLNRPGTVIANGNFRGQTGLGKGDTFTMMTPAGKRTFTIVGGGNDYINAKLPTVYVSQDALAELWGVTTDIMVLANAKEGADRAAVRAALEGIARDYPSFALYDSAEWQKVTDNLFAQLRATYTTLALMLAIPSLLALLNTLAIGVLARTREIGMLRAVGATRRQVKRMVVGESLLLASVGVAAGLVAGVPLSVFVVKAITMLGLEFPYVFPWSGMAAAVAIGLAFAGLAAWYPARQAAKLDVIRALRYE
ncbi:MAG: ABC transporter permease [Coriobacteriia bacterium]|nr:ABC transporter permease [Coriobacteriia bacterium]